MKTKFLLYKSLLLLIFVFVSGFSNHVSANHIRGLEISYQCTDTPQVYKVTIKVYRDCAEIQLCSSCSIPSPNGTVTGCTTSSASITTNITGVTTGFLGINYGSFVLNAVGNSSGYDIINTCDSVKTICTNCNTRTAGTFSPGVEVYTFEGNVNLSSIPTACCRVELGAYFCCRGSALTTITSTSVYTFAQVDRCQSACNSAPIFTNNPNVLVCGGVDYVYNLGANDPDGDSLSYAFGQSYQSYGTPAAYVPPYSAGLPFPYFGSIGGGTYPAGLRIDPVTGDVLFRPMGVFVSKLIIEVTQWKNISGVPTNVGVTRRDVEFQTQFCTNNRIPRIKAYKNGILQIGNYNTVTQNTVTAGQQICLDIVAEDQYDLTTSPPTIADTTKLIWNNPGLQIPVMANATFTTNYILANRGINGPKADSFKFCWTPPLNAARYEPYLFTVSGSDRFCPINAIATRGIKIKVDIAKTVMVENSTKQIFCNNRINTTNVYYRRTNMIIFPGNVFTVQLSDSAGSFASATTIGTKTSIDSVGFIPISIPANLFVNKNYKIRVNASSDTISKGFPFDIRFITGFSTPVLTNNRDSFCQGLGSTFKVTPNSAGLTYKWLKNNTVIANETKDSLLVDSTFTYRAIVSNTGCADTSNAKFLTVYPKPIAGFIAPNTFCIGNSNQTVNITNTSTLSSGSMSYNWWFNNTNSTVTNPNLLVTDSSNYLIKLVVTSNKNCVDSITKNIAFRLSPKAIFTINDSTQCVNSNSFVFTNSSDSVGVSSQYNWNFGTGNNLDTNYNSQTFSYTNTGNYLVKLKAISSNGCIDSISKTVIIFPKPVANFNTPSLVCLGNNSSINLNNTSSLSSGTMNYNWVFGNNTNSNLTNPNLTVSDTGNMAVKLIATSNNGCIDSISKTINFQKSPIALFTINDSTQCLTSNSFVFANSSDSIGLPIQYIWNFGTGNNLDTNYNSQTFSYTNAGNYLVKLKVISTNGCIDSVTKQMSVFVKPSVVNFSINNAVQCFKNNNFVFTNQSLPNNNTLSYLWKFGDGTISTNVSPTKKYLTNGAFDVTLIVNSNSACVDSITKSIYLNSGPSANFTINNASQCFKGNSFIFTNNTNNATSIKWNFGDGTNSTLANLTKTYTLMGNFQVQLIANDLSNCKDTINQIVNVNPSTNLYFNINNAVQCLSGNQFIFTNTSNINIGTAQYKWVLGEADTLIGTQFLKQFNKTGNFDIKLLSLTDKNCAENLSKSISVNASPTIGSITGNAAPNSLSNSFNYSISSQPNLTYFWYATNGTIQSGQGTNAVNVVWPIAGTGYINVQITNSNGCNNSTSLAINITNVGINNLSLENDLNIFPNPTKNFITITNKNNLAGKNYIIENLVGQTVLSGKLNLDETIVNLETLQSGMYFLILDGMNRQSIKIIKE
ncbi:MAG: PKD domain-containing protein [Bacteroidia bacterium]